MDMEMFDDHISQGVALMIQEQYPAAKREFEAAVQINPQSAEAYSHLGNACANLEQYDEALTAFKNAMTVEPGNSENLFSIGNIYLLQNDRLRAVEFYNRAEEAGFHRPELYQILATIFYNAGDTVQALRNISKCIAVAPFEGEARLLKARIYLGENRYEEALDTLEEMQKILPDSFEAYDMQAQIYLGMGRSAEALEICNTACSRFPEDAVLALTKLKVLIAMDQVEQAASLVEAMKKMPNYETVYRETALQEAAVYLKKTDSDSAIQVLTTANAKVGGDMNILFVLLDIYNKLGMMEKSAEASRKLIDMQPGAFYMATARFSLAEATDKLGKTQEAIAMFRKMTSDLRKATIADPSFYEGYIFRLLAHTRLGEYEKALSLADYLHDLQPDAADSYMYRYHIYTHMGDSEKAEEAKKAALEINPDLVL